MGTPLFSILIRLFFLLSHICYLYILDIKLYDLKFSSAHFIFLIVCFTVQKLLSLMEFFLCIFAFVAFEELYKKKYMGVPVVAQWLTNPTRNHEVAGSVPALPQWVNDLALP